MSNKTNAGNPANPDGIAARLILTIDRKGTLQVNGPIQDRMLCFGMLELAKQTINDFHSKPSEPIPASPIEVPTPDVQGLLLNPA